MERVREGYIEVTGGKVWYREVGCGRKGIPLLILHGGPGASHDYLEPLAELSVERPVVFYDQLGCGNSDRPDDLSLWTVARYAMSAGLTPGPTALKGPSKNSDTPFTGACGGPANSRLPALSGITNGRTAERLILAGSFYMRSS